MEDLVVQCPYCFETVEVDLDPETTGVVVQDCDVCCHPLELHVTRDEDGAPAVAVRPAQ